jgi:hypothetical protein
MLLGARNAAVLFLPALVGAGLHLLNVTVVALSLARRRPYPWDFVKWTFSLATTAFMASILGQMYMVGVVNGRILSMLGIFLLPGLLQSALLWWPRLKEPEPAVA